MAEPAYRSEPLFNTVLECLFSAYRFETIPICPTNQLFADLRGGTVKLSQPLSKLDRITQAVFTQSLARRSLLQLHRTLMDAYFTVPIETLTQRKIRECALLSFALWEELDKERPRWFLNDVVREWAGLRPVHTDAWWCEHLGVTDRTLRYYKHGRSQRNQRGAVPVLEGWYSEMVARLEEPFFQAGLI